MAYEEIARAISLNASVDLSADDGTEADGRNRFVSLTTDDPSQFALTEANGVAIGVSTQNPGLGQAGRIVTEGTVPVVVGAGGVTAGAGVSSGANGVAVAATSTVLALALEDGAEGEIVSVALRLPAVAGA